MPTLSGMSFTAAMILKVVGKVKYDGARFALNVGHSEDNIALHFNPRFKTPAGERTIAMNSKHSGSWNQEQRETNFPFSEGAEFEVSITFDKTTFDITLPDGSHIKFPNRFGDSKYKYISFSGDATMYDVGVRPNMKAMLR